MTKARPQFYAPVTRIQMAVAEHYGLSLGKLLSPRRRRTILRPRQMAMALSRALLDWSLPEIGEAFEGRDHTTVLHACRRIEALRRVDHRIEAAWNTLLTQLKDENHEDPAQP